MTISVQLLDPPTGAVTATIKNSTGTVIDTLALADQGDNFYSGDETTLPAHPFADGHYTIIARDTVKDVGIGCLVYRDGVEVFDSDIADVSGLETEASAAARAATNQSEHDATQLAIAGIGSGASPADNYAYFTDFTRADAFKADVSGLATSLDVANAETAIVNQVNANEVKLDTIIANIAGLNNISVNDIWTATTRSLTDKAGFELAPGEYANVATAVEQAILNEGDGQQVLNAIVGAIGNTNVNEVALVAAIVTALEQSGGGIDNIQTTLNALNDLSIADVETAIQNQEPIDANIVEVTGTAVTDVDDFKADVSGTSTLTPQQVRDAMKLAPSAGAPATDSIDDKLDGLETDIGNLPDNADIKAQADQALIDYDAPTKAELDTFETNITNEVNANETKIDALNDLSITDIETAIANQEPVDANIVSVTGTPVISVNDFKADISGIPTAVDIANAVWTAATRSLTDKTGFELTAAERTAIATAVQVAIIDEGDGQQVIDAILQVFNANLDIPALELVAIAQAVRTELTTELSRIDVNVSSVACDEADIADAVWDEPKADHTTPGTMGERALDSENFSKIAAQNTQP